MGRNADAEDGLDNDLPEALGSEIRCHVLLIEVRMLVRIEVERERGERSTVGGSDLTNDWAEEGSERQGI